MPPYPAPAHLSRVPHPVGNPGYRPLPARLPHWPAMVPHPMHHHCLGVWTNYALLGSNANFPQYQLFDMQFVALFDPNIGNFLLGITYDLAQERHEVYVFPDLKIIVRKFAGGNVVDYDGYISVFSPDHIAWLLHVNNETRDWARI